MGMVVRSNIMAMNANRSLGMNNTQVSKNLEKLSSGFKINRAGDDASGLAISEKMKAQIKGLETASANAQDGISLVQTAEGALTEVHSMLNRMIELATKSANGTIQDPVDREAIQSEVDALLSEIDRIGDSTNFNGIKLLDGSLGNSKAAEFFGITAGASTNASYSAQVGLTADKTVNGHKPAGTEERFSTNAFFAGKKDVALSSSGGNGVITINYKDAAGNAQTATITLTDAPDTTALETAVTNAQADLDASQLAFDTAVADPLGTGDVKAYLDGLAAYSAKITAAGGGVDATESALVTALTAFNTTGGGKVYQDALTAYEASSKDATAVATLKTATTAFGTALNALNVTAQAAVTGGGSVDKTDVVLVTDASAAVTDIDTKAGTVAADTGTLVAAEAALAASVTSSVTSAGIAAALNNGNGVINDNSVAGVKAGAGDTVTVAGADALKDLFTISLNAHGELQFVAKTANPKLEVESVEFGNQFTAADKAPLEQVDEDYDHDHTGTTIGLGTEIAGHKVTGQVGVPANYILSSAELDLATVETNSAISLDGKTYIFQRDGEELSDAAKAYKNADGTAPTVISFTSAADAATKLAKIIDEGDNKLTAHVTADAKILIQEDQNQVNDQMNESVANAAGKAIKIGDYVKSVKIESVSATKSANVKMSGSISNGATISLNGKTFEFLMDPATAKDGNIGIELSTNADPAAAARENADRLAAAYNTETGTTDATSANGVVTFANTDSAQINAEVKGLVLQVGDTGDTFNMVNVSVDDMRSNGLGIAGLKVDTAENARAAIDTIKNAINQVSTNRANLGALQNRLEYTINNLDVSAENMSAANSRIRDTDMAKQMMEYTKTNVLTQAAQAMLAQANQQPQSILQLLQ